MSQQLTFAVLIGLAVTGQGFVPVLNHGAQRDVHVRQQSSMLQMIGGGQWWNQNQNTVGGGSNSSTIPTTGRSTATSTGPPKSDEWMVSNLESTSKDMIQSYHDEVIKLKATMAEMMEKFEAGAINVDKDVAAISDDQVQKVETVVVQASGDIVDSVSQSVGKLEQSGKDAVKSQMEMIKGMDEKLQDMQEHMETQTKLLLAQTRQRQIHFALENVQKFSFSYSEHGRKKDSAGLVEEILWLFQKNFGMIIPEQAIFVDNSSQMTVANNFKYGGGSMHGQPQHQQYEEVTEEGKEAFRTKLLEQLEMLLGVKPTIEVSGDGQYIVRLEF